MHKCLCKLLQLLLPKSKKIKIKSCVLDHCSKKSEGTLVGLCQQDILFFYSAQVVTLLFLPCVPFVPLLLHHFGFLCGTKKAAPQKGPLPELCFPPDILSKLSPHYTHLLTSFTLVFFLSFFKHNGMTSMDAANARCATFLYVSARKKCPALTLKYIFNTSVL